MNELTTVATSLPRYYNPVILIILVVREMVWKGIALWKAGRKNQVAWFVVLFIFNTAGILPIIYLLTRKKNK